MKVMQDRLKMLSRYWRLYTLIFTPLIFSSIFAVSTNKETRCAFVIIVMAFYWMSEAIPMAVTALIPAFAFPLFGVISSSEISLMYMKETNILFLGGLIVATAVEHCNLHKRIALFVILHVGQSPRRLMIGFMLTTMFLSMWISNTASTAMMVPIVDAILQELYKTVDMKDSEPITEKEETFGKTDKTDMNSPQNSKRRSSIEYRKEKKLEGIDNLAIEITEDDLKEKPKEKVATKIPSNSSFKDMTDMYYLAVAYGANIGGTGSLTGTGPNLVVKGVLDSSFSAPTGLNFGSWMAFNVPGMLLCTVIGYFWLQFMFVGLGPNSKITETTPEKKERVKRLIRQQYNDLGIITFHEKSVLTIFISLVLLWLFREPGFIPGWAEIFKTYFPDIKIGDGPPAILAAFLLFIIPAQANFWPSSKRQSGPSPSCITWSVVHEKVPWGIILLLGGGFAMAKACNESGLSIMIGEKLRVFDSFPVILSVLVLSACTAITTEVASNTATASIIMPILKELALKMCVNPLYLMIPAAVCCSYAFMLPVATPPNAIVFGAANMSTAIMMKAGFVMNILCVLVINIMINTLGVVMFNVGELPAWVNSTTGANYTEQCVQNITQLLS